MLQGKHILIGISGGIAAYKIPQLIRLFKKDGAEVKVTTTKNALEFVTELTLQTLSNNKVYTDVFAPQNDHSTEHISLPDWADLMIVAPATANIVGKMACGIADDALSTTYLAMQKPVLIAPAMNDKMYAHPALQHNINTLRTYPNTHVMECAEGELACGTSGKGRMQEVENIYEEAKRILCPSLGKLSGKRVLITAGPTQEKIDPVRFISNYSTGKMGIALAEECTKEGAEVTLVLGPTAIRPATMDGLRVINVTSGVEMMEAAEEAWSSCHIGIMCAAVADYRPSEQATQKIKREKQLEINLPLVANPDIAATLGSTKKDGQILVGFALETQNAAENAAGKLRRKNLDMIVVNSLEDKGAGFGTDTNKVTLISANGTKQSLPLMSKTDVAKAILNNLI